MSYGLRAARSSASLASRSASTFFSRGTWCTATRGEEFHPLDRFPMVAGKIGIADSVFPVDLADEKLRVGEDCQAVRAARLARGQAKRREKGLVFRDVVRRPPQEEGLGREPLAVLFEKDPRASGSGFPREAPSIRAISWPASAPSFVLPGDGGGAASSRSAASIRSFLTAERERCGCSSMRRSMSRLAARLRRSAAGVRRTDSNRGFGGSGDSR